MTFWVNGFRNVTTSYGINGFTDDHLAAFKQTKIERILFAYDNDTAGNAAIIALTKKLTREGVDCYRINFPKNMDANEYALQVTPATKSLGLAIRKAEWLGQGERPALTIAEMLDEVVQSEILEETKQEDDVLSLAEVPAPTEASPQPDLPSTIDADITEKEIKITLDNRLYRVRGLQKNTNYEQLKINLRVSVEGFVYVDQLDLYNARQRQGFIKQASTELGLDAEILKMDLGKLLLKLESLQEDNIKNELNTEANKAPH